MARTVEALARAMAISPTLPNPKLFHTLGSCARNPRSGKEKKVSTGMLPFIPYCGLPFWGRKELPYSSRERYRVFSVRSMVRM